MMPECVTDEERLPSNFGKGEDSRRDNCSGSALEDMEVETMDGGFSLDSLVDRAIIEDLMNDVRNPLKKMAVPFKAVLPQVNKGTSVHPVCASLREEIIAFTNEEPKIQVEKTMPRRRKRKAREVWAQPVARMNEGRRSTRVTRRVRYEQDIDLADRSSVSSSESEYHVSDMQESDEESFADSDEDIHSIALSSHSEDDAEEFGILIDEEHRKIAVVDAFKGIRMKPMSSYVRPPVVVTTLDALQPLDEHGVSSATMSLSTSEDNTNVRSVEEVFSKTKDPMASLLDRLAEVVHQISGKENQKAARRQKPKVVLSSDVSGPIKNWYKGFDTSQGMALIYPNVMQDFTHPHPLYEDEAPRWLMKAAWSDDMLPTFDSTDVCRGSIQYLKYAAVRAGRFYCPPIDVQKRIEEEYHKYEDTLDAIAYVRMKSKELEGVAARKTRRSKRQMYSTKLSPLIFCPRIRLDGTGRVPKLPVQSTSRRSTAVVQGDPAAATDVRWGPSFQAKIPPYSKNSRDESREDRLGGTLVLQSGSLTPPVRNFDLESYKKLSRDEKQVKITEAGDQMINAAGALVDMLGLRTMGAREANTLTEDQQEAFGNGMKKHGRNFPMIQKEFLPNVSCCAMASYYYDVWKLQAVPAAKRFYQEREEARMEEEAARALEGVMLEKEAARRAENKDIANRRRLVKDSILWARLAAKCPNETNFNKNVVRERLQRAIFCMRKAAEND